MSWREHLIAMSAVVLMVSVTVCRPTNAPATLDAPDGLAATNCQAACERMAALGCPEAKPTTAGLSCVQVCEDVLDAAFIPIQPTCIAGAQSIDAVRACNVRCQP